MPRALELLDLPGLFRTRNNAVALDTTRLLTRGNPIGAAGLLSYLNPSRNIYSAVSNGGTTLFGGVTHSNGGNCARLLYLAPADELDNPNLPALLEHLSRWFDVGLRKKLSSRLFNFQAVARQA